MNLGRGGRFQRSSLQRKKSQGKKPKSAIKAMDGRPVIRPTGNQNVTTFSTGAVRSADADDVRYDLISPIGLRRLAEAYAEGAKKYEPNNWLKGFPISSLLNHAIRHIFLYLIGDKAEDHIGHAAWNLVTAMHFQETRPDLNDLPDYTNAKQED